MSGVFRNIDPPPPHCPAMCISSEDARHCSVLYIVDTVMDFAMLLEDRYFLFSINLFPLRKEGVAVSIRETLCGLFAALPLFLLLLKCSNSF